MPLYDYTCAACHKEFEVLLRHDSAGVTCPACGSTETERRPSVFAVDSAGTRQASLNNARKQNLKVETDKAIANQEYINKHHQ